MRENSSIYYNYNTVFIIHRLNIYNNCGKIKSINKFFLNSPANFDSEVFTSIINRNITEVDVNSLLKSTYVS